MFIHTEHSAIRMQQRGCRKFALDLVLSLYDTVQSVGDGCMAVSVSHRRARSLGEAGLPASVIERLERLTVIVHERSQRIVTILKGRMAPGRKHARRRRR
jgi:hypothetical protein